jgi:FkbM family methyltransferase
MATGMPPTGDDGWRGQVARLANGMPIEVDPRDMIGSDILRSGVWEMETVGFVTSWLRRGMTFVDAGAHVGQYTLLASGAVGPAGRVIAFEPHPVLFQVLRRNVSRAGCVNVTVSQLALGRAAGPGHLVLHPPGNYGASSLRPDAATAHHPRMPVQVITLDEALSGFGRTPAVDLVKIDVEGAELDVIEGARGTLAASPGIVLIVEFLRANPLRFGHTVEDVEARLRELGFQLFTLTPHGPRRYRRVGELSANVVAVRRLTTLLSGLPEVMAARTLRALAATSPGRAGSGAGPAR